MKVEEFSKKFSKTQPIIGFAIILALFFWGMQLNQTSAKLAFSLAAGVAIGYILTRTRFGFAGGIKRIYVRGEGSLTKALLLAFGVAAILYGAVQWHDAVHGGVPAYLAQEGDKIIHGTQNVYMTNIGTVVGAFIFGIGMIIAGGCASGTLADFGEGEGHAAFAFPFFVLATIPGHYLREVVDRNPIGNIGVRAYLPDYFGYFGAIIVTIVALMILYGFTQRYEKMRKEEGTYMDPLGDYEDFEKPLEDPLSGNPFGISLYHKMFVERWSFNTGAILLSAVSGAIIIFKGKAWGVTSAFTKIAVWFVGLFGIHFTDPAFNSINKTVEAGLLSDGGVILDIGIVCGSFIAFLLASRFKANYKFDSKNAFLFSLGGLFMGFGSRFAKGCNIGALYSSIPNFSLSGWIFMFFISLGAVAGLKIFAGGKSCLVPPRHRDKRDFK
ncbi:hypothetical protein SAMN05421767_11318 [Granulicatella balaenopterae]|uniref:Uncharacterized protein n=1 Tax=Granulicatella balaenopterae TaxID=137733 RepID=A0A1H9KE83_9LACT|nr:YeeE/YedE family protein [Granulicatella balaenopterae]SEQ97422.1 hypothetical protein SAMN05421767_11318 [Granulicatella balaenopterae]